MLIYLYHHTLDLGISVTDGGLNGKKPAVQIGQVLTLLTPAQDQGFLGPIGLWG
jgi:hypothetical protein